jgi:hypothetical protein
MEWCGAATVRGCRDAREHTDLRRVAMRPLACSAMVRLVRDARNAEASVALRQHQLRAQIVTRGGEPGA